MRVSLRSALGAFLLLCAGCGGSEGDPLVLDLAALYEPPGAFDDWYLGFDVPAESWRPAGSDGLWQADAPWGASDLPLEPNRAPRLVESDVAYVHTPDLDLRSKDASEGAFSVYGDAAGERVLLQLDPAGPPPGAARLEVFVSAGEREAGEGWRIAAGPLVSAGFVVRAGEPVELDVDVPEGHDLRFATHCFRITAPEEAKLRVLRDGEEVELLPLRPAVESEIVQHRFALPAGAARLRFELDGPPVWLGIHGPRLVPSDPAPAAKPDVVLFLADTFRADGLTAYGGEHDLTPNLDAFADEALVFRRTWSPACWTLPSQTSMFLGLYPYQHGAVRHALRAGDGLRSITESLRDAGYRTAAVTEALYVSRSFDIDRGFEWFEEYSDRDFDQTLRRAEELLAADDGRPLFLFVHTYRTHEPYFVDPETLERHGARLGIHSTWREIVTEVEQEFLERAAAGNTSALDKFKSGDFNGALMEIARDLDQGERPILDRLRALYRGGVIDLDRGFGRFLTAVDGRSPDEEPWVLFTSDHGEAFAEHDGLFHGRGFWEENLRIPLMIRGPGLAAQVVDHGATLVDVPHTLAQIAGIPADETWMGDSLLRRAEDPPVFAFDCAQFGERTSILIHGNLKVVTGATEDAIQRREVQHAFDLRADPLEQKDLAGEERPRTTLDALAEDVLELLRPRADPAAAELDAEQIQLMKDAGYMGESDD